MDKQDLDNSYKEIIQFYREHPAEFVEKCFGVKLTPYQKMALTKNANQSQTGIICWNRANQKYAYALFEIIRASIIKFCNISG